jgi:hypothetical protein
MINEKYICKLIWPMTKITNKRDIYECVYNLDTLKNEYDIKLHI